MTAKRLKKLLMGGQVVFVKNSGRYNNVLIKRNDAEKIIQVIKSHKGELNYRGIYAALQVLSIRRATDN